MRRAAKRSRRTGSSGGRYPTGTFERLDLRAGAQWLRIPFLLHKYDIYSREEGAVVSVEDPYYEYTNHYVPSLKTFFQCSSGAYKTEPCYPHAILAAYYDEKRAEQERTGVKPNYDDKPVSASQSFAFAVTGVDRFYAVPVYDKAGKPRFMKDDTPITNWTPASILRLPKGKETEFESKYGHNMHWTMGTHQRDQLLNINETLMGTCATCGDDMFAQRFLCTGEHCKGDAMYEEYLGKVDIQELTQEDTGLRCSLCSLPMAPSYECACGHPSSSSIFDLELRLRLVKTGDEYLLELVDHRPPTVDKNISELLAAPLDVQAIYAPTPLAEQRARLGGKATGVDPMMGTRAG